MGLGSTGLDKGSELDEDPATGLLPELVVPVGELVVALGALDDVPDDEGGWPLANFWVTQRSAFE